MSVIKAVVDGQSIMLVNTPKIASNGINENMVEFTFDESWDGFGKTAMFYKELHEANVYQSIINNNGMAIVPYEVTNAKCKICFGVVGAKDDIIYTTEVVKYNIVKGVPIIGSESEPPSPTIYQQMLSLVGQIQNDVISFGANTENRLNAMSSQMDEFIAEHAGTYGETVLWDSEDASGETISGNVQTVTLSENCSGYDYIDIHFGGYIRTNTGANFVNHYQTFFEPDYSNKEVDLYKWQFTPASEDNPDGIHFKIINNNNSWSWSGNAIDDAANFGVSRAGWPFDKIVGRKLVGDAELVDARVGVDGTVYQTVGAAIRGQINDIAGETVELDTTLIQQGKAAESKSVGDALLLKADKSTTYTKAEVDNAIESASVVVDSELNELSTNAIQNGVVAEAIGQLSADLGALSDTFPRLSASDFEWTVGKSYTQYGTETSDARKAHSDKLSVSSGITILNRSDKYGIDNKVTLVMVCEYDASDEFIKRTIIYSGESVALGNTTASVALVYGYEGASGVTLTAEDIAQRFAVSLMSSVALSSELMDTNVKVSNSMTLKASYANEIQSNTDLNNITTPGNYRVNSSAVAGSLAHTPVTNAGYKLTVVELIGSRYMQIAYVNAFSGASAKIYTRNYNGSAWSEWLNLATKEYVENNSLTSSGIALTSSNYLEYFPNGSLDDAPINSVVWVGDNVPLTDGPDGDDWIGYSTHTTTGRIKGTLITLRAFPSNSTLYASLTQMLIGYRVDNEKGLTPTLSYRVAILESGAYVWSAWSKLSENMCLRSGNRVISAGRMSESVSDLNDLPSNVIYQIDKNCTGETEDSTLGHHPAEGKSCVVSNMAFSYSTRHGSVQTLYVIDGSMYWRYGYQQSQNDFRWTPWRRLATEIPDAPTTDGAYVLKCTVSNGTPTYAWVAE